MTEAILTTEDLINNISRATQASPGAMHPSLYAGMSGMMLFEYLNSKRSGIDSEYIDNYFEQLSGITIAEVNHTFCTGKSGINWFYNFLYRNGSVDEEDLDLLCFDNELLLKLAVQDMDKDNYDFLHGTIGTAYAMLYNFKTAYTPYFVTIFGQLERLMNNERNMIPDFDYKTKKLVDGRVNLGLAHGIPSVLKFCMQCYSQGVCKDQAKAMALKVIDFLKSNVNTDTTHCYFAYVSGNAEENAVQSRMAWCYGDLSIAVILHQAGRLFADPQLEQLSVTIALHSASRRSDESTQVCDAGVCHGSAGLAYMFQKMEHYTRLPELKEAADYWINRTMAFARFEDGPAGFKKFNPSDHTFETDYGLLEGAAGIGLVLYTYVTGDFSWDYCLMLND